MSNKFRNIFMAFGIIAIVIMLCTMDMDYTDIWHYLKKVGLFFPLILALWLVVYLINTLSWYLIITDEGPCKGLTFWRVYKLTVSGFALNYTTPCGLMGGEPYRIMELKPYTGVSKATSSVILYVMMHIFSHFWFWTLSILLFLVFYPVGMTMAMLLAAIAAFCILGIYFFVRGYKTGMAQKGIRMLTHVPFIKGWACRFAESKKDTLQQIDSQIAMLHKQHKRTFYSSLLLELFARILQSLEIYLILKGFDAEVSVVDSILILAFSSLFSNLIFFTPMQLGTREGGLALAVDGLHLTGALGVYTGLITRLRELFWIAVGVMLIKVGNKNKNNEMSQLVNEDTYENK